MTQLFPSASFKRFDVVLLVAALVVAGLVVYFFVWPKMTQYKWGSLISMVFSKWKLPKCSNLSKTIEEEQLSEKHDKKDVKRQLEEKEGPIHERQAIPKKIKKGRFSEKHDKKDVKKQLKEKQRIIDEQDVDKKKLQQELTTLRIQYENVVTRWKEEEAAKQEALTRLSEHIALNLADNNPDIADLSDINRPTNLVEKFALLYDDEWTEAFDALQELPEYKNEEKTIELLLGFVMFCFNLCREMSSNQLKSWLAINGDCLEMAKVPREKKKLIKETRKKCAEIYIPLIYNMAIKTLKENHGDSILQKAVDFYIKRCTELCWLMSVQDPPMVLTVDVGEDRRYNKLKFREYTKVGPFIDFVVWPVVLIQDGGCQMAKGVAQCCDSVIEPKVQTVSALSGPENKVNKEALIAEKYEEENEREINLSRETGMAIHEEMKRDVAGESSIDKNEATKLASANGFLSREEDADQFRDRKDEKIDICLTDTDKTAVVKQGNANLRSVKAEKEKNLEKFSAGRQGTIVRKHVKRSCEETKQLQIELQVESMDKHNTDRLNNSEEEEHFRKKIEGENDKINTEASKSGSGIESEIEKEPEKNDELEYSEIKNGDGPKNMKNEKEINLSGEIKPGDAKSNYVGEEYTEKVFGNLGYNREDRRLLENGKESKHHNGQDTKINLLSERKPRATENDYKKVKRSEEVFGNQSNKTAGESLQKNEQIDEVSDETGHKKNKKTEESFQSQHSDATDMSLPENADASEDLIGQKHEMNLASECKSADKDSICDEEESDKKLFENQDTNLADMDLEGNGEASKHDNRYKKEKNNRLERKPDATEIFEGLENGRDDANSQGKLVASKHEKGQENEMNLLSERKADATYSEGNENKRVKRNDGNDKEVTENQGYNTGDMRFQTDGQIEGISGLIKCNEKERIKEVFKSQVCIATDVGLQGKEDVSEDELNPSSDFKPDDADENLSEENSAREIFEAQENGRVDTKSQGNREKSKQEKGYENEMNVLSERKPDATDSEDNVEKIAKENDELTEEVIENQCINTADMMFQVDEQIDVSSDINKCNEQERIKKGFKSQCSIAINMGSQGNGNVSEDEVNPSSDFELDDADNNYNEEDSAKEKFEARENGRAYADLQENRETSIHEKGPENEMNLLCEWKPDASYSEGNEEERAKEDDEKAEELIANQCIHTADIVFQVDGQTDGISDEMKCYYYEKVRTKEVFKSQVNNATDVGSQGNGDVSEDEMNPSSNVKPDDADNNFNERESAEQLFEAQENGRADANSQGNRETSIHEKSQENEINLLSEWKPDATDSDGNEEERAKEDAADMRLQGNGEEMGLVSEQKQDASGKNCYEDESAKEVV